MESSVYRCCGTNSLGRANNFCLTVLALKIYFLFLIYRAHYKQEAVDLKVPRFSCHQDRAVCCHGYVEIKKLPGDLGQLGAGNCIRKLSYHRISNFYLNHQSIGCYCLLLMFAFDSTSKASKLCQQTAN